MELQQFGELAGLWGCDWSLSWQGFHRWWWIWGEEEEEDGENSNDDEDSDEE
jgi:hypothetical protein